MHLIRTRTDDALVLEGNLQRGRSSDVAWLLVHGTGSNFYAPGVLQAFAEGLLHAGHSVARINTRGHDIISSMNSGAAFESIADCTRDLRAWVDELTRLDFSRVVLAGHSMGAVKGIFSQVHDPHPNVVGVVGVSPPRFCHAEWQSSQQAAPFRESFRIATELVANGRGDELIRVTQPLPLWLTASGFLAKYGPHDDYDFVPLLPRLSCPTLLIVGTDSVAKSPAFASIPDAVTVQQSSLPHVQLALVPGANISYSDQLEIPPRLATDWFASVVNGTVGR